MASKPFLRLLPVVAVIAALPYIIGPLALEPIREREKAEARLAFRQEELAALEQRLQVMDQVTQDYHRSRQDWTPKEELCFASRDDALALVRSRFQKANVHRAAVNGNVLTLEISGMELDSIKSILKKIEKYSGVQSTVVYRLTPKNAEDVAWFVSILLEEVGQ